MSAQEKDELMRTVQAQVALANMQELLTVSFAYKGLVVYKGLIRGVQFLRD